MHSTSRPRLLAAVFALLAIAPPLLAATEGLRDATPRVHAFEDARLVIAPGRTVEKGTLVIRDGLIEAAGAAVAVPADAVRHPAGGLTIYPGFVDLGASFGLSAAETTRAGAPVSVGPAGSPYLKDDLLVRPELDAAAAFAGDSTAEGKLRRCGFTAALVTPSKGLLRGQSALVGLGDGPAAARVLRARVAQGMGFDRGRDDVYPDSPMGAVAALRQTLLDAAWYRDAWRAWRARPAGQEPPAHDPSLEALGPVIAAAQPLLCQATDEWYALRAARIAAEARARIILLGSGYEYRRLEAIRALGAPVVLPLHFPAVPEPAALEETGALSLADLRHVLLAPGNAAALRRAGVTVAFTARGREKPGEPDPDAFRAALERAVEAGLSPEDALAALTTVPAELAGERAVRGTLEPGKAADFLLVEGDIFRAADPLREVWVAGERHAVDPRPLFDPAGQWTLELGPGRSLRLDVAATGKGAWTGRLRRAAADDTASVELAEFRVTDNLVAGLFDGAALGLAGRVQFSAHAVPAGLLGRMVPRDGAAMDFSARRTAGPAPLPAGDAGAKPRLAPPPLAPLFPPGAFGRPALPPQPDAVLVRHATVWTMGPRGVLRDADLLVRRGKIAEVGPGLAAPAGALVVEASGRHVTPGLIDAHSHIAVSGAVNEGTQAVSAEVRIGDVLDPDDIAIYRQLAGGLTVSHLLHGSANPIGGQCQLVKLRWGALDEEMKFEGAPPTIKFALGENVKQSNWGDKYKVRYPQSRMGVEALLRDAFQAASDYRRSLAAWKKKGKDAVPPRRDLELETLVEILEGRRLVHCHSYMQDEILMLMRVAEEFGFRVACFQHTLEGYKVAEALRRHGAGASIFTDWWAYKFEVYEAIPSCGAILHDAGVLTSFNSDSDELARRMNLEAAKAVKYGGLAPEEALAFVTINPAKQLRVEARVGSLEPGKDADFVIWSGDPLSSYSRCEQTWVDGRRCFDLAEDLALREAAARERREIVQHLLALGTKNAPGASGEKGGAK